jgi:DNA (cytosine-5)-methyltransferase 1
LFTGLGGADLAAEWAGFKSLAQSEIDPFCSQLLKQNFPGVPNLGDIRKVTDDMIKEATDGTDVTVLSGGFPCQPWSCAGKQRGTEDDRDLWPEMLRVIELVRPAWVVGENVANFVKMGLDRTLSGLEAAGYSCRSFVIPACAVGASHLRNRVFVVAHNNGIGRDDRRDNRQGRRVPCERLGDTAQAQPQRGVREPWSYKDTKVAPDDSHLGLQEHSEEQIRWVADGTGGHTEFRFPASGERFDSPESCLCRSLHGIPCGVDRIKALGNAIVPQQIHPIFSAIAEIENTNPLSSCVLPWARDGINAGKRTPLASRRAPKPSAHRAVAG